MDAVLVLEDGQKLRGPRFGARTTTFGELVFNTNMTGYCESLTDPSYCGQILMMTYPLIGNYGVDPSTWESARAQVCGFVVHELWRGPTHPTSRMGLDEFLREQGIPGIERVDTRALTTRTRSHGTLRAALSTEGADAEDLLEEVRAHPYPDAHNLVQEVSCTEPLRHLGRGPRRFVVIDCGVKGSILSHLLPHGEVVQMPYATTAQEILAEEPDGVLLSNGPGNPAHPDLLASTVQTVSALLGEVPLLGICLGHQLLGLACGAETFKLKFGHRGGNQPVKDLDQGRVFITAQNHGFAVTEESLPEELAVTHRNLNDHTVEGFASREVPLLSVQYHPEASPGPHDSHYVFHEFLERVDRFAHEMPRR